MLQHEQLLKNVTTHAGYHSCERCTQKGVYLQGAVRYPDTDSPARTNQSVAEMLDEDHHKGPTPLHQLNVGLVSGFVLDYMHLVCLGVMRRLLNIWLRGSLKHRISANTSIMISQKMIRFNNLENLHADCGH